MALIQWNTTIYPVGWSQLSKTMGLFGTAEAVPKPFVMDGRSGTTATMKNSSSNSNNYTNNNISIKINSNMKISSNNSNSNHNNAHLYIYI